MTAAIVIDSLSKSYGSRLAVDGLSLSISPGDLYGFLGPNGAGKTTTIRVILGLLRPSTGAVSVLGRDAWSQSATVKANVGYLSGDLRLYPWMNVQNALRICSRARGRDLSAPGLAIAERFQLPPEVRVHRMSRGMRQKLGLVLCLAHDPQLLVLDEPTTALDPPMQNTLYDVLRERARAGTTVFFSSHALSEVETLCSRVAILREGRLVVEESLDALRQRAKRTVLITWANVQLAETSEIPHFLSLEAREGLHWRCSLVGDAIELVQWAHGRAILDLAITPPDLETLFRRFYEGVAP